MAIPLIGRDPVPAGGDGGRPMPGIDIPPPGPMFMEGDRPMPGIDMPPSGRGDGMGMGSAGASGTVLVPSGLGLGIGRDEGGPAGPGACPRASIERPAIARTAAVAIRSRHRPRCIDGLLDTDASTPSPSEPPR
jgi:hypothetical protein